MVFNKVIKHFDGILFWKANVIRMTAMIKLRHQQPSLWHRGLAEDIEGTATKIIAHNQTKNRQQ